MRKKTRRAVVAVLTLALVFGAVGASGAGIVYAGDQTVKAAAGNVPDENYAKYIEEAVSAGLLDVSIYGQSFTADVTRIEAVKYVLSLYRFLGGADPALPATHPFVDTIDIDAEKAAALGLISPDEEGCFYPFDTLSRYETLKLLTEAIALAMPAERTYIPTPEAAFFTLNQKYVNAGEIPSAYLPYAGYLDARGILLLPSVEEGERAYFNTYGYEARQGFFILLDDAAWALAKSRMQPYQISLEKPKPFSFLGKYSKWRDYHETVQYKNNLYLGWNSVAGAYAYRTTLYVSKKKKATVETTSSYLALTKQTSSTYVSIFGNHKKKLSAYANIVPVDRHGNAGKGKLKLNFKAEKFNSEAHKLFGAKNGAFGFKNVKAAKKYQKTVRVKVWKLRNGKKVRSTMSVTVNKELAADVKKIFAEIYKGKEKFPVNAMGGFQIRSSARSEHNHGTAIDINPTENCMKDGDKVVAGSFWKPGKNKYSIKKNGDVVKAFEKYGWYWGGYGWGERKDYMHFSYMGT